MVGDAAFADPCSVAIGRFATTGVLVRAADSTAGDGLCGGRVGALPDVPGIEGAKDVPEP